MLIRFGSCIRHSADRTVISPGGPLEAMQTLAKAPAGAASGEGAGRNTRQISLAYNIG